MSETTHIPASDQTISSVYEDELELIEDLPTDEDVDDIDDEIEPQSWQRPAGLLGDITEYIYQSSIYPNVEVSIAGAIVLMAGICGRSFNTHTASGLDQYVVLLAGTGQGKEGAASGISRLFKAVRKQIPAIGDFAGPSNIASAQALLKYFQYSNCFWSHKGEFGFWLQKLNDKYANANDLTLKGMLLDLYHKSGHNDMLMGSIYADRNNNAPSVDSPSLTLYGDTTPNEFYKAVDERSIRDGLISRLLTIPVPRIKPDYCPANAAYMPPEWLVNRVSGLVKRVCNLGDTHTSWIVPETAKANEYQLKYQKLCQNKAWKSDTDPSYEIWRRNHIKLLRLGALIAVGVNPDNPIVELSYYEWAKHLIEYGSVYVQKRFQSHRVGFDADFENIEVKQMEIMRKRIKAYSQKPYNPSFRVAPHEWSCNVVSMHYLKSTLYKGPLFKDKDSVERTATKLIEAGDLQPVAREGNIVKSAKLYRMLLIEGKPPTRFFNN